MSRPRTAKPAEDRPAAEGRGTHALETALVGLILLLGLGLRSLHPEALAVEHFDEGVYASNLVAGHLDPPFAYPMRHLYAPPLFPAVLEWAQIVAGPAAVMGVNVVLGSLMVLAVWWTTRCWFGPRAAIAAALLAATSEYHIAFSRMALTDVPLSLFMLLGVFAGWKATLTGRPLWIATAGLLAGLAWCTKYNGWLTLAVTGAGTAAFVVVTAVGRGRGALNGKTKKIAKCKLQIANCKLGTAVVRWGLTAVIAGLVFWGFVVRELGPVGGYAAVAKNHAGYFVGLGGWWSGLVRQAAAHRFIMGWPTIAGIAGAWLGCAWVANRRRSGSVGFSAREWAQSQATNLVIAAGLVLLCVVAGVSGVMAMTAVAGCLAALWRRPPSTESDPATRLAAWMLLAWFVGLLVATPLYYPYPRLWLPWVVACWPMAGAALAWLGDWLRGSAAAVQPDMHPRVSPALPIGQPWLAGTGLGSAPPQPAAAPIKRLLVLVVMAMVVGVPLVALDSGLKSRSPAWQPRQLLAGIAQLLLIEVDQEIARDGTAGENDVAAIVYVAGDPALFYQLATLCRARPIVIAPVADASQVKRAGRTPTFLVVRTSGTDPASRLPNRQLVVSSEFVPSDLVLLDRLPAGDLWQPSPVEDVVTLYEVRPGGS